MKFAKWMERGEEGKLQQQITNENKDGYVVPPEITGEVADVSKSALFVRSNSQAC